MLAAEPMSAAGGADPHAKDGPGSGEQGCGEREAGDAGLQAEYPQTACMNTVRKKNMPKTKMPTPRVAQVGAGAVAVAQQPHWQQGVAARVSITANAASSTAAAASEAMTLASPQRETPSGLVAALIRP